MPSEKAEGSDFILAAVKTGNSDYTRWRRQVFDGMSPGRFDVAIRGFAKSRKRARSQMPGMPYPLFE